MKKVIIVAIIALLGVPVAHAVEIDATVQGSASFSDVLSGHENFDAIHYVYQSNIVKGYADGTYQPGKRINRAEFTKIIIAAQFTASQIDRCVIDEPTKPFPDTEKTEWFTSYVCIAKKNGIIGGYPDGTFKPEREITFVEAAKVISIAFGANTEADVQVWYRPYVKYLSSNQAIPISINQFNHALTRGEMAEMIYRLKTNNHGKTSHSYESLSGEEQMEVGTDDSLKLSGQVLAGKKSQLINFNQADYDKALASDKLIVLYFYANWCPICTAELPHLYGAFDVIESTDVVGFRVNYNDNETDDDEEALASEHGVAYQHTKVFVKNKARVLKSPEAWEQSRYIEEINARL